MARLRNLVGHERFWETWRSGLPENSTAKSDGVIKQFSDKYPGVEIDIYTLNDDGTTSLATSVKDGHYK